MSSDLCHYNYFISTWAVQRYLPFFHLFFSFYIRFDTHVRIYIFKMHKICMDVFCKRCDTASSDMMLNIACNSMICYIFVDIWTLYSNAMFDNHRQRRATFWRNKKKKGDILAMTHTHIHTNVGKVTHTHTLKHIYSIFRLLQFVFSFVSNFKCNVLLLNRFFFVHRAQ